LSGEKLEIIERVGELMKEREVRELEIERVQRV
jgi:hypothetical protein